MSHEIESADTMIYHGERPWHGLGIACDHLMTAREAQERALLWEPLLSDMYIRNPRFSTGSSLPKGFYVEGHKAVVRSDRPDITLGVVGDRYTIISNGELAACMDAAVSSAPVVETAGSLRNGKRVWMLARGGRSMVGKKDAIDHYILVDTAHDGSGRLHLRHTNVRVVCANTLSAATENSPAMYSVMHTASAPDRIRAMQTAITQIRTDEKARVAAYNAMAVTMINSQMMIDTIINAAIPVADGQQSAKLEAQRGAIQSIFDDGIVGSGEAGARTVWAAYNAVTEYLTHMRKSRGGSAWESQIFGSAGQVEQRAFDAAMALVK